MVVKIFLYELNIFDSFAYIFFDNMSSVWMKSEINPIVNYIDPRCSGLFLCKN